MINTECVQLYDWFHLDTINTEDLGTSPLRAPRQQSIHLSSTSSTSCNFSPSLNDKCPLSADNRWDSVRTYRVGSLGLLCGKLLGRVALGAGVGGFFVLKYVEINCTDQYYKINLFILLVSGWFNFIGTRWQSWRISGSISGAHRMLTESILPWLYWWEHRSWYARFYSPSTNR